MQFFKNLYYKDYSKKGKFVWNACMKRGLKEICGPILYYFKWHELILDEGHEILGDEFTYDKIQEIQSKYDVGIYLAHLFRQEMLYNIGWDLFEY